MQPVNQSLGIEATVARHVSACSGLNSAAVPDAHRERAIQLIATPPISCPVSWVDFPSLFQHLVPGHPVFMGGPVYSSSNAPCNGLLGAIDTSIFDHFVERYSINCCNLA